jgi:hypothetical protein
MRHLKARRRRACHFHYAIASPVSAWHDAMAVECILESEPCDCKGYAYGQSLSLAASELFDYAIGSETAGMVDSGVTQRIAEDYGLVVPE